MRLLTISVAVLLVAPATMEAQDHAKRQKIHNAMSAAPERISQHATIKDWDGTVLREGASSWVCYPAMSQTPGDDPMCLDEPWQEWVRALMAEDTPNITRMGFGYMLAGASPESNLIPMAGAPTPDNEWLAEGVPHLMIIVPDVSWLEGLPTHPDEAGGGPWVMWRGTPFVHIMAPMPKHEMRH